MIQEFIDYIRDVRALSERTVTGYEKDLRQFAQWASARELRWSTLSERDIDAWLQAQAQAGIQPATRNRRLSALRSMLTWAQHKGILRSNASRYCQRAQQDKRLPQPTNAEGIDSYLQETPSSRMDAEIMLAVALMVRCGLRIEEVRQLRLSDTNETNGEAIVIGKGRKARKVYFDYKTASLMQQVGNDGTGRYLGKYTQRELRREIEERLSEHVGKMHPHQLRHTFACTALNNGMPIEVLSKLLGHAKIETTQIYAEISDKTAKQAYERALFR